jgi:ligand-binding sensor domain-containing protein/signal transduction histidine kinase/DNA-binding response OmpR family regulator
MHRVAISYLVISVLMGLVCGVAHAQTSSNYYGRHLDITSGLSQNTVQCIIQDKRGFMWFGTKDGLDRYDGVNFKTFRNVENNSYKFNFISDICEHPDGTIWAGTDDGVRVYDPVKENVSTFNVKTRAGVRITNNVTDIDIDKAGNVWIVVENQGVFRYNPKAKELKQFQIRGQNGRAVIAIRLLTFDDKGTLWMGTMGQGLWYSSDGLRTIRAFLDNNRQNFFTGKIIMGIKWHDGRLYVGTDRTGLYDIDPQKRMVNTLMKTDEHGIIPLFRCFSFVKPNEMWIGTESGIYILDLTSRTFRHDMHSVYDPYSLSDNAVYAIEQDHEGGIWIGSYFGGVNYLPHENIHFEKYYENGSAGCLTGQRVRRFCKDGNGNLWIGTEDKGLNKLNPATDIIEHVNIGKDISNIHGLCCVGTNLWVGTFANGIKVIDTRSGRVLKSYRQGDKSQLLDNYVFAIMLSHDGRIYLGTTSGLQYYDAAKDRFVAVPEFRDIFVYDMMEDRSGNMWVGTYAFGLYCHDARTGLWKRFIKLEGDKRTLPSNRVYSIYQDSKGTMWILTQGGMCSYNPRRNSFDQSIHNENFPQQVVYQMVEDNMGNYWITTNHGLYNIDRRKNSVYRFTTNEGLLTNQFNYSSSFKDQNGKIYFGEIEGFIAFDPKNPTAQKRLPKPVIVDMWVFNKHIEPAVEDSPLKQSIAMTDEVELASNQNSLTFNVVSLSYSAPTRHRIKYMLEGLDKGWNYLPADYNRISYSNLGYGDYVLKVVSFNENEEKNGSMTELKIVINPPFYRTIWADIIYLLMFAGFVYYAMEYYRRRNLRKTQYQMDKYKQEKEKEVYDAKFEFFTNIAHEIRTPLTLIKAPLDSILRSVKTKDRTVKENLDIMNLNVDRLMFLANQLLDFRRIESNKYKIKKEKCDITKLLERVELRFEPTIRSAEMQLTVNKPEADVMATVDGEAITKILSNLFVNATKYGKSYIKVTLETDEANGTFVIRVANDGEIIAKDKREEVFMAFSRLNVVKHKGGAGIGLPFARSLAQLHGGTLLMSDNDEENEFVLTIPIESEPSKDQEEDNEDTSTLESILQKNEKGITALVVEDNVEMCQFINRELTGYNYNVFCAANGKEALSVLDAHIVDVVISDVMMPEMDGFELCREIKTNIKYSHIPVILLTARTDMSDKIKGLELNADAYIVKPFAMEYLVANVDALIRNRKKLREAFSQQTFATTATVEGLSKMDEDFLRRLNEIIKANYQNPDFTMDEVVKIMNVSRSNFYRKIKGILDMSPNDYIRIERLKKAAELLKEGRNNVTEICYMVGFSSPSYFAKCFQKQYGVLPKDYVV